MIILITLLLSVMPVAAQAACANGANYAGCAGPNGAATYNKNTGQANTYNRNASGSVTPGTHYTGPGGNSATKAVQQGCAWVNGQKKCN